MSMIALGRYIEELRSKRGFSRKQVADELGVSDRIVVAWERGEHEPKVSYLVALLQKIGGSWLHVDALMQPDATEVDAIRLAHRQLQQQEYYGLSDAELKTISLLEPDSLQVLVGLAQHLLKQTRT